MRTPFSYSSDPTRTAQRIAELGRYVSANVMDGSSLVCGSASSCRSAASRFSTPVTMWEGQMSHVGLNYDMSVNGRPWRILVLGLEIGRGPSNITLEARRLDQNRAISVPMSARNPHMRGTMTALRIAYGGSFGVDREGELLLLDNDSSLHHAMGCYSLVNKRLCSLTKGSTTEAVKSSTLDSNCLAHLKATISILEPNLVIIQSKQTRSLVDPLVTESTLLNPGLGTLEYCSFAGVETIIATFSHPSARQDLRWGDTKPGVYVTEVLAPTLEAAIDFGLR